MRHNRIALLSLMVLGLMVAGCSTAPKTEPERESLADEARTTLQRMQDTDATLREFLDNSIAYAVFPNVGKGGLVAGGAYGRGIVYQNGAMIGYADITQATVGAQVGGQTFSQVVVFQNQDALDRFKSGKLQLAANASAVALKTGAGASAKYTDGVAIFIDTRGGLMAEAAVGGQQLTFQAGDNPRENQGVDRVDND